MGAVRLEKGAEWKSLAFPPSLEIPQVKISIFRTVASGEMGGLLRTLPELRMWAGMGLAHKIFGAVLGGSTESCCWLRFMLRRTSSPSLPAAFGSSQELLEVAVFGEHKSQGFVHNFVRWSMQECGILIDLNRGRFFQPDRGVDVGGLDDLKQRHIWSP